MTAAIPCGVSVPVVASHPKARMPSGVPLPTRIRLESGLGDGAAQPGRAAAASEAAETLSTFLRVGSEVEVEDAVWLGRIEYAISLAIVTHGTRLPLPRMCYSIACVRFLLCLGTLSSVVTWGRYATRDRTNSLCVDALPRSQCSEITDASRVCATPAGLRHRRSKYLQ